MQAPIPTRPDYRAILKLVTPKSSVLDLGCGNGELLELLIKEKNIRGQGVEISEEAIYQCVARGLSVFHGDIDSGLADYQENSFDYIILNQTLQQVKHIDSVFDEALKVAKKVIVGVPNFAYYKARFQLFFKGRAPVTGSLPYAWYETPNLRFLSTNDFIDYCKKKNARIEKAVYVGEKRRVFILPNLFATVGIFVVSRRNGG